MKLDSLLASSTTVLDHSFAFESESQPYCSTSNSNFNDSDQSTNSKRAWEPWRVQESTTRISGTLGDPFVPTRTESSTISNAPSRSTTQNIAGPPKKQIQPLIANGSRVLPPPMSWNGDKGSYQQPSRNPASSSQRYAPTFHSIRQTLNDLDSHLAQVRSYPELLAPNGDQLQVKTHEQIHSTLITLYHSNSAAQESSRSLTFTYNLYVEAASFLRFLPHPITPFKLLSLSLLLLPSHLGQRFRRIALPPGSETKLSRFQIRPGTTLIYCIEEVIEVCGMLSGWYAASNWECREQWSMWETELRQEEFAGVDYSMKTYRDRDRNTNQPPTHNSMGQPMSIPVDSAHSNLSASRPRGSISSDPHAFTSRPLLNARSSMSSSSPVKTSYFYPPSPDSSMPPHLSHQQRLAARAKPRGNNRPMVNIPQSNSNSTSSTSSSNSMPNSIPRPSNAYPTSAVVPRPTQKPYIPHKKGVLPMFRRPPLLPPIIPVEEFARNPTPSSAIDANRSIATSRPKRLGPLEMIAWSDGDSDEDSDAGAVGRRISKRPKRAVSRGSSNGYNSSDFE